jgi:galactokinase
MIKKFFTELDIKGWAIVILGGIVIILFLQFMLSPSGWRKKIKEYEKINKELQAKRDSLDVANKELKKLAIQDSLNIVMYQQRVDSVAKLIKIKDVEILKLKKDAKAFEEEMKQTKEKIKKLTDNPIKRTGNELLESIKQKTK